MAEDPLMAAAGAAAAAGATEGSATVAESVYYAAMLDLRGRRVLLVGGGSVAAQKVAALLHARADVQVVAPSLGEELARLHAAGRVSWVPRSVREGDTGGAMLVVCCTGDRAVNARVSAEASSRGILVNVVDDPELCTFIAPATVQRGEVQVAISTGGASPALAKLLRRRLEAFIGEEVTALAALARRLRTRSRARGAGYAERDRVSAAVLPELHALLRQGRYQEALLRTDAAAGGPDLGAGRVYLVGAGPGDPSLITVRGLELLAGADVVVTDALVHPALLRACRTDARIVDAGKRGLTAALDQEQINALLVSFARAGSAVVRLKGGDPYVFGRGGEERDAVEAAGVRVEVVPGVSSALSGPAALGIPVTHRDWSSSVTVVSAASGGSGSRGARRLPAATLAGLATEGTVVVLMGARRLRHVLDELLAAGVDPQLPAAAVQWATDARQRQCVATVGTLARDASELGMGSPMVIIIGQVVRLGDHARLQSESQSSATVR